MFIYIKCQIIVNTFDEIHQFNSTYRCTRQISPEIHFTIKLCEIFKHGPHVKISPEIDVKHNCLCKLCAYT